MIASELLMVPKLSLDLFSKSFILLFWLFGFSTLLADFFTSVTIFVKVNGLVPSSHDFINPQFPLSGYNFGLCRVLPATGSKSLLSKVP
jgi:hypothetical protein